MQRMAAGAIPAALALMLTGCADPAPQPAAAPMDAPSAVGAAPTAPLAAALPPAEALAGVLYRLADPALPGTEKLDMVQDAGPADATTLDRFATALRDGGFGPLSIDATDIRWSEARPDDVVATIRITPGEAAGTSSQAPEGFSFPMEFRTGDAGWQLTRDTAEMLLAFPAAPAAPAAPAP